MLSVMRRIGRTIIHCKVKKTRDAVMSDIASDNLKIRQAKSISASCKGCSSITTSMMISGSFGDAPSTRSTRASVRPSTIIASTMSFCSERSPRSTVS